MNSLRSALQRRRPRVSGLALALIAGVSVALCPTPAWSEDDVTPNVVIHWNDAALHGVRDSKIGPEDFLFAP
jgi:hypothetical protein